MIEFNGYLSGAAEEYFHKNSMVLGQRIVLICMALLLPAILRLGMRMGNYLIVGIYCSLFIIIPLLAHIPRSKKERKGITPKKIFTEDGYIVCVADKYTETKLIEDVKLLKDHGEFYELVFPFGKISDKFICQKSLLVKGTLAEFEELFTEKLVRL